MSSITNSFLTYAGSAILDFGATPGTNIVSVEVSGQTNILTSSNVKAFIMGESTISGSTGHNAYEHAVLASKITLTCGDIVTGCFRITGYSDIRMTDKFAVRWEWR